MSYVNAFNFLVTVKDIKDTLSRCRAKCHILPIECLAKAVLFVAIANDAKLLYLADVVVRTVFDRWQYLGKALIAQAISTSWYSHIQCFMRALRVVYVPPCIKVPLALLKGNAYTISHNLCLQASVKPLLLSQGLGVIGSAVDHAHSQPYQPHRQGCILMLIIRAPGGTIVHQDSSGQTITSKDCRQMLPDRSIGFMRARPYTQGIPRMIVKHRQRMASPLGSFNMTFKIHLPQVIRGFGFKPLPCLMLERLSGINTPRALQYGGNRAGCWNVFHPPCLKPCSNLATSPRRMVYANQNGSLFHGFRGLHRTSVWASVSILKTSSILSTIASYPFVAGLATNSKPTTQLRNITLPYQSQRNKLHSQRHQSNLFPRHISPPLPQNDMPVIPVTYVSEQQLPMYPVYTPSRGREIIVKI